MTPRQLLRMVISLLVVSFALPAVAAKEDTATLKKIDEALNVHYLAAEYDKAEEVLVSAIKACGTKSCSSEVLAKAHVAVGVIRGNAKQDMAGARAAFEIAKVADPYVTLDAALVTPAVLAEFNKVMGREPPAEAARPAESPDEPAPPDIKGASGMQRASPAGDMRCTPFSGYEVQTAQPIAVVCDPPEGVVRAELYYRIAGDADYTAMLMSVQDGTLRANIPCEPLTKPGKLEVYIIAQDFNKELVDTFGNILTPAHYMIVQKTNQPAPTYPGQPAPKRCTELFNASGEAGIACTEEKPCGSGLYCAEGTCRKATPCEADVDCESNKCNAGFCEMEQDYSGKEPNRWMFGLHFGADIWLAPGVKQVCGNESILSGDYNCYNSGDTRIYQGESAATDSMSNTLPMTDPGFGGNVDAGVRFGTLRALLSADYVLTRNLSVGGRLGWAFNGGPRTIHYEQGKISQSKSFLPVHIEARGTLWLRSLGRSGLHPYVHLGAGVAEVDAKIPISAKQTYYPIIANTNPIQRETTSVTQTRNLDAWRKMGTTFVTIGFGGLYTFSKHLGVQLNINAMYMLPSTGIIIEPSLGFVVGF